MKKIAIITGALSSSLTSIGILLKITHWPGANILLVFGIGLFAVVFVPIFAKYLFDKD